MATIKSFSDLNSVGGMIFGTNLPDFPALPELGQIAHVNGTIYAYTSMHGQTAAWYPLTNKQSNYTHYQGEAATTWVVQHDLGSENVLVMAYDQYNQVMTCQTQINSVSRVSVYFTEPMTGRVEVFAPQAFQEYVFPDVDGGAIE